MEECIDKTIFKANYSNKQLYITSFPFIMGHHICKEKCMGSILFIKRKEPLPSNPPPPRLYVTTSMTLCKPKHVGGCT
jgi:hypothetical protein